jgi:hypothetical protein
MMDVVYCGNTTTHKYNFYENGQDCHVNLDGDAELVNKIAERLSAKNVHTYPSKIKAVRLLREFITPLIAPCNKPGLMELKKLVEAMIEPDVPF